MNKNLSQEITAKKIRVLYRHGHTAIIGILIISLVAAAFVYFVIWPAGKPAEILLTWLIMTLLVSVIRLYGIVLYRNNQITPAQSNYWLYAYLCGTVISGCLWGLFFLYLTGIVDVSYRNFMIIIMGGMLSAAAVTYAASLLAFNITALTLMGPVIIYFILDPDPLTRYTGYSLIIYLVFLSIIVRQLNKTLEDYMLQEFNISRLEQEKQYAAMINQELEEEILKRIQTEGKLKEEVYKAEALADRLITISSKDGLTGISNRRRFDEYLENEWNRSARSQSSLALILCDIDYYKAYNDTYGHLAGDDCLKKIAGLLEHYARRAGDMAARYGGEEFVIILPDTREDQAARIAEEFRSAVEDLQILHRASAISDHITVSLGVAAIMPSRHNKPILLINLADEAMYKAKHSGRNRVIIATPGQPPANETVPVES